MATTFSEITNIVEYLKAHYNTAHTNSKMHVPIHEIDGIRCVAHLDFALVTYCRSGTRCEEIRFEINADYKEQLIFYKTFDSEATTHEDIVAFIKTIRNMKYCKTTSKLCVDPVEDKCYHERKFLKELLTADGEACNYKLDFGECPVCLDNCYTILSCGHHLCLPCESNMKKKTCPQCRDQYDRFADEDEY